MSSILHHPIPSHGLYIVLIAAQPHKHVSTLLMTVSSLARYLAIAGYSFPNMALDSTPYASLYIKYIHTLLLNVEIVLEELQQLSCTLFSLPKPATCNIGRVLPH